MLAPVRSLPLRVFLFGTVVLAATPVVLLSGLVVFEQAAAPRHEQQTILREGTLSLAAQLGARIRETRRALAALADLDGVQRGGGGSFGDAARLLLAGHRDWNSIILRSPTGDLITRIGRDRAAPPPAGATGGVARVTAPGHPGPPASLEVGMQIRRQGASVGRLSIELNLSRLGLPVRRPGARGRWTAALVGTDGTVLVAGAPELVGHKLALAAPSRASLGTLTGKAMLAPPVRDWGAADVVFGQVDNAPLTVAFMAPHLPVVGGPSAGLPSLLVLFLGGIVLPFGIVALGARSLDARMRRLVRDARRVSAIAPMPELSPSGVREIDAIREVLRVAHRAVLERSASEARLHAAEVALIRSQRAESIHLLMSGIAHDFGNLAFAIAAQLELVRGRVGEASDVAELIERAKGLTNEAGQMMRALITAARTDAPSMEETDLNELIRQNADLLRRAAGAQVRVEFGYGSALWHCRVNNLLARSALFNLVVNARTAMPEGGSLRIETENRVVPAVPEAGADPVTEGAYALVTVTDTGTGIAPDVLARIFDPFFTSRRHERGVGLGLTMVREFMQLAGGAIHVSSTPGQGTSFRLYFPALLPGPEAPASPDCYF